MDEWITYLTTIDLIDSLCSFWMHLMMYSVTTSLIGTVEPAPGDPFGPVNRKKFGILSAHIER